MPELAAIYAVGILSSLILTMVALAGTHRRRSSQALVNLNTNLARIGLFWSDHRDDLVAWTASAEHDERRSLSRSLLISGTVLSTLSWVGLVFLSILFFSARFLARSRLERNLLSSELAHTPYLASHVVDRLVAAAKGR